MQVGKYIGSWLLKEALTITGVKMDQIPEEDKCRFTYARRHGGSALSTLRDQIHGAYTGFVVEALYPAGIGKDGDPKEGDFSIIFEMLSNVRYLKRILPHRTYKERHSNTQ